MLEGKVISAAWFSAARAQFQTLASAAFIAVRLQVSVKDRQLHAAPSLQVRDLEPRAKEALDNKFMVSMETNSGHAPSPVLTASDDRFQPTVPCSPSRSSVFSL